LEQGLTRVEIADRLGVCERTIYSWLAQGMLDRDFDQEPIQYRKRPAVSCKIDPYRAIIDARLAEFPRLSATRLCQEVKAAGYDGSYVQIRRYVRQVRPKPPADPVVRFETPAGHQAQVDFAEFRLPWGRRYALVVVLAYSRLLWLQFYTRQTAAVLMSGLEEAFTAFGGVPSELLFDQMKAVVVDDQREVGGKVLENTEFLRFAKHWGFRIRACRPYRARTKGKVERPIGYVRQGFFYGRTFLNDADLNAQAQTWIAQVANVRQHGTTGEAPQERFERDERARLKPLAAHPYRSVLAPPPSLPKPQMPVVATVERRPLAFYDRLAGVRA
jgi:transposase